MAALTFVQANAGSAGSSVNSFPLAYTSNTTSGSYLLLITQIVATGHTVTVTDTLLNTWSKVVVNDALASEQFEIWHVPVNKVGGGANTVTVTINGTTAGIFTLLAEYTGQATVSTVDVFTPVSQQASPTATYGPITTTVAGDSLVLIAFTSANITWTPGVGYTSRINGNNAPGAVLFDNLTGGASIGTYSTSSTAASSSLFGALLAIKSTSGGGSTTVNWVSRERRFVNKR